MCEGFGVRFTVEKDSALSQPLRDPPTPLKASGGCYLWQHVFLFMETKDSDWRPWGPTHPQDSALWERFTAKKDSALSRGAGGSSARDMTSFWAINAVRAQI